VVMHRDSLELAGQDKVGSKEDTRGVLAFSGAIVCLGGTIDR
jgi:hypothetical protein